MLLNDWLEEHTDLHGLRAAGVSRGLRRGCVSEHPLVTMKRADFGSLPKIQHAFQQGGGNEGAVFSST